MISHCFQIGTVPIGSLIRAVAPHLGKFALGTVDGPLTGLQPLGPSVRLAGLQ